MTENRMYEEMMKAARSWLAGKDPAELARNAGVEFDGNVFRLQCLGQTITVTYPDYSVEPSLAEWLPMVILHYLYLADGTPLTGQQITFAQQKDGMIRGGGFDALVERQVREVLGTLPEETLRRRCKALGGMVTDSNADLCARFFFLPRYPMTLKLWFADEEFPASGRLLLDSSAEHYLTIEDSVAAGDTFLYLLTREP